MQYPLCFKGDGRSFLTLEPISSFGVFAQALAGIFVREGELLAAMGNCIAGHKVTGGKAFAVGIPHWRDA